MSDPTAPDHSADQAPEDAPAGPHPAESDPTAPDHSADQAPEDAPAGPHPVDSLGEALHSIVSMVEASPVFHAMGVAVAQARARIDAAVAALKGDVG